MGLGSRAWRRSKTELEVVMRRAGVVPIPFVPGVLLLAAVPVQASVIHVNADATGAATGASWTDAFTDLQDALALA